MNSLLTTPEPPHRLFDIRLSPSRSMSHNISNSRKRKVDDDEQSQEDRMSSSPSESPKLPTRSLPAHARPSHKRARSGPAGRSLALPRLLETLDAQELRGLVQSMCSRHPDLVSDLESTAPRPSVPSALGVLKKYEEDLHSAFPFGGNPSSEYAYNRVRQQLLSLLDALADFTPHFLPPNETQITLSLQFLDGATNLIHRLPDWSSFQHQLHKQNAYEEIAGAWTLVIKEAAKRAGGVQLVYGGWDQKIKVHNEQASGKLQEAVDELIKSGIGTGSQSSPRGGDLNALRQEMLSAAYGSNYPVRVGPWYRLLLTFTELDEEILAPDAVIPNSSLLFGAAEQVSTAS